MKLDTRFLTLHPATARWFERRERCRICAHVRRIPITTGVRNDDVWRCAVAPEANALVAAAAKARGTHHEVMHCIDASADDGPCGADAVLFKEKK